MLTVKVTAKTRFTHTLGDGTIVHMDPKDPRINKHPELKEREIGVADALRFHDRDFIEDFKDPITGKMVTKEEVEYAAVTRGGFPEIQSEAASTEPAGPVTSMAPTGGQAPILPAGESGVPTHGIRHVGGGHYEVVGPAGPVGEKIKGKVEAQTEADRLNLLNSMPAGVRQHPVGPTAGADTEHGNGELEPSENTSAEEKAQDDGFDPDSAPTT